MICYTAHQLISTDNLIIKSDLLNQNFRSLLTEEGSLTKHIKQLMKCEPKLTCLMQKKTFVDDLEKQKLSIKSREYAHVREILMGNGDINWMFARSVIPFSTLRKSCKRLAHLNTTPLGTLLFQGNFAKRLSLEVSLIKANSPILQKLKINDNFPLWQRVSIFEVATGPLLVREIFLPNCPIYLPVVQET